MLVEGVAMDHEHPQLTMILQALTEDVGLIKRAVIGEDLAGNRGLVKRVDLLEQSERSAEATHQAIDDRRSDSIRRVHERIEEVEEKIEDELQAVKDRVNRVLWVAFGIGISSGLGAGWLTQVITP